MKAFWTSRAVMTLLIALAAPAFADRSLYRSNGFGLLLEKIQSYRKDEYGFVVEVEKAGGREVRRLFEKGKEVRRWIISFNAKGMKSEERELEAGRLAARRAYGSAGDLLLEEIYFNGKLSQKAAYQYEGGELASVRVSAADGTPLYTDHFLISVRGSLRKVKRTYHDGSAPSSSYAAAGIGEERDSIGGVSYVTRYDGRARVRGKDRWKDGKLVWRQEFTYRPGKDLLLSSTERSFEQDTKVDKSYDEKGRLIVEIESASGKQIGRLDYAWDADGKNTVKSRRSEEGLEEWFYSYGADGELSKEEYFRRGSREKTTIYSAKDERYEELYKDGQLVLRVYYKGDTRIKEEVLEAGKVLSERSIE